ncbi:MAG: ABC transporter ATP-binding protein [Candidatus Omnitrophota bacterium]
MAQRNVIISVRDLTKSFGGRKILDGVSMDIYEGETIVVMGGSGCGKSTFLRHLIGAIEPDKGQIHLFGKDIARASSDELDAMRKKFGMLFQSGALFDSMSVGENIALPLREHTKLDESVIGIMIKMMLEHVGLRGFEDLMPSQLSGGMKKRVGLARALIMDPKIVFYDEPTAGLDPIMTGVIDKLVIDLTKKLQITSVVVTHDMASVFRIADRIVMFHQGKIVGMGTPEEIRASKNPLVQQFITGDAEGPVSFVQNADAYLDILTS